MKRFILGLLVGIAVASSYLLMFSDSDSEMLSEQSVSAEFEAESLVGGSASALIVGGEDAPSAMEPGRLGGAANPDLDASLTSVSATELKMDTGSTAESASYSDDYAVALEARIDDLVELLDLDHAQRSALEERLLGQMADLTQMVGEASLDPIMIDEFSIGFEDDLSTEQRETFALYRHEKAMYAATVSSEALVAGVQRSTGISEARANELAEAVANAYYKSRTEGEYIDVFGIVEASLSSEEWAVFRESME